MKKSIVLALAASVPCCVTGAYADDTTLEPVTVTATQSQKVVSEAPASVSVVTDKDIENKNADRLDTALSGTAGVFVKGLGEGTPSNYSNQILLRGMPGYQRTAVMIDGVSINDGFSQGVNTSELNMDDIKQIEVVPGPFSSLYGGSAMGGVINVITKDPEKREFILRSGYGSDATYETSGTYRDRFQLTGGYLGVSSSLDHAASDGFIQSYVNKSSSPGTGAGGTATGYLPTQSSTGAPQYTLGDQGNVGWTKNNANLRLVYSPNDRDKITAEALYSNVYTSFDHPDPYLNVNGVSVPNAAAGNSYSLSGLTGQKVTTQPSDYLMSMTGDQVQRYKLSYQGDVWNDATLKAIVSRQQDGYWYVSPNTTGSNKATASGGGGYFSSVPSDRTDMDLQIGKPLGSQHYILAGVSGNVSILDKSVSSMTNWQVLNDKERTVATANGQTVTEAAYFQEEYTPLNRLTLYGGGRYDTWTTHGSLNSVAYSSYRAFNAAYGDRTAMAFSPKASAVYKIDADSTLRAAWGKAFRTPSLSDMYSGYTSSNGAVSYPNPSLAPEKATSWEVGGEHRFPTATTIKGTYFSTQVSNLIYVYTAPDGNYYTTNAGASHIHGIELEARQKLVGTLEFFANQTVQNSKITENAAVPSSVGKQNTNTPKRMFNIGIDGDYEDYFGSFTVTHVSKTYRTSNNADYAQDVMGANDPYTTANAKIGWHITDVYTATASVSNIFDKKYYEYYAMPGRTYFAGLSAHF